MSGLQDFTPICGTCKCTTCRQYTRAYLHSIVKDQAVACHLISVHNVAYQLDLMREVRQTICSGTFPDFVARFMAGQYPKHDYPVCAVEALSSVGIHLK